MAWYEKDKYKECCHNDDCESFDTCIECWDEWAERNPPMTNADHIRAMSDDELFKFIWQIYDKGRCDYCPKGKNKEERESCTGEFCEEISFDELIIDWLKQPYREKEE